MDNYSKRRRKNKTAKKNNRKKGKQKRHVPRKRKRNEFSKTKDQFFMKKIPSKIPNRAPSQFCNRIQPPFQQTPPLENFPYLGNQQMIPTMNNQPQMVKQEFQPQQQIPVFPMVQSFQMKQNQLQNGWNQFNHNPFAKLMKNSNGTNLGGVDTIKMGEDEDEVDEVTVQPKKRLKYSVFDPEKIVGSNAAIEKDYVRNISKRHEIRPLNVLKLSLQNVKKKFMDGNKKYPWVCNQLKSIRQDLRVQNIESAFTVKVYESHGRLALRNNDIEEFSSCIAALFKLYEKKSPANDISWVNRTEFIGYKILFLSFTNNDKELHDFLGSLFTDNEVIGSLNFKHAMTVLSALKVNNYFKIFNDLIGNAPPRTVTRPLMFYFRDKNFLKYLSVIVKSHIYTSVSIKYVQNCLGFKTIEPVMGILSENLVPLTDGTQIDCKLLYQMLKKRGIY